MMGALRKIAWTSALMSIILASFSSTFLTSGASLVERTTCKDSSPNCEKWATEGMCSQDPDMEAFMGRRCPYACDVCGARGKRGERRKARAIADLIRSAVNAKGEEEEEKRGCLDMNNKCENYAVDGLCSDSDTTALMAKMCPYACDRCKREVKEEEENEVEKEEVEAEEVVAKEETAREVAMREVKEAMKEEREVSLKEIQEAMAEEREMVARSFASLISDAASADDAADAAAANDQVEKRSCRDFSVKCPSYAVNGLCGHRETSTLMAKTCPSSCGRCKRGIESDFSETDKRSNCKDNKTKCETWATHGMCNSDPDMQHFMAKTCPFACSIC